MALRSLTIYGPRALLARRFATAASLRDKPAMFCMQCEQTQSAKGCTVVGVCGKTPEVAALQDLLVENLKEMSVWADLARKEGFPEHKDANRFTINALFSTMTNVNFDANRFANHYIPEAVKYRDMYKRAYKDACKAKGKVAVTSYDWEITNTELSKLVKDAKEFGVLERKEKFGPEINGLQELAVYGLKGLSAYASHAVALGKESDNVYKNIHAALAKIADPNPNKNFEEFLGVALGVGATNLEVLKMLDEGHTAALGDPTPTSVPTKPVAGKAILVSGHDLHDLQQLLQQTEGTGINIYTHGEMLPAHSYPELKKFPHLKGHYGGPWQLQKFEFAKFPGPIVMTTNCLIEPRKSYKDRIYSCNAVGFEGVNHIPSDPHNIKDFSDVIEQAKSMEGFKEGSLGAESKPLLIGFGHKTVLSVADKVIDGVRKGHIKHFFLIGGCDGNETERSYFRDLAMGAPNNTMILTLGCGKYRINNLELGDVPNVGLPRLLDMGQCNDSYGAVVVALELAKAFNTDVNGLPLSFAVSWFEQKAVAVLLTLLHLGVKNIHLGPNLPAFVGPKLAQLLTEQLGLRPTDVKRVQQDLKEFMG